MIRPALTLIAACITFAGCASKVPEYRVNTYQYDSQAHSGTVKVSETTNVPAGQCGSNWRDMPTYQPTGVRQTVGFRIELQLHDASAPEDTVNIVLPSNHGQNVVVRDFQKTQNLMLAPDHNGIVSQGDYFFFPSGFFVRASQPEFEGNNLTFCLGVDRTYLPESELSSPSPLIHMDRLNIRYTGELGKEAVFKYGSVELSVKATLL